jgi:Cu-Zn family superoxide dismutase
MTKFAVGIAILSLTFVALGSACSAQAPANWPPEAVAVLMPTGSNAVQGTLVLTQKEDDVQVTGEIRGLKPGQHGFHIHQFGDLRSADGSSAGGHYNPSKHQHGGPNAADHHAGDLGNITADDQGIAKVDTTAEGVKLSSLLGRSLVVHADADDLKSQPAGNSGPRIAVGVIGLAEVKSTKK